MNSISRRHFLQRSSLGICAGSLCSAMPALYAQDSGQRPFQTSDVTVLNPRHRVPVGLIIDDSTCLVNLNRFAMPQFDLAHGGKNASFKKNWKEWPAEIPDAFVRKFGEWCAGQGVKGKYSIVPYPACVGRLDRLLPGWSQKELGDSLELVRSLMVPNWDIHPEMITHTRVIDVKTGHPYPETSTRFMENWDWTTGRSTEEMTEYLAYALNILKNVGLNCEGITTPGGFGNRARPQLAQGTLNAVRDVFKADVTHYFRDLFDSGTQSVEPRVEYASGLEGPDPRCVVHVLGCTGDWTGGWDCSPPEGADRFITQDLQRGRMVEVIERGEPAFMVCHWTGIYWNGQELGFKIFQEVVRRLKSRFDNLVWAKNSEVARYWAARKLTRIERINQGITFNAPFQCPDFTVRFKHVKNGFSQVTGQHRLELKEVSGPLSLQAGTWCRKGDLVTVCLGLPKGKSSVEAIG